MVGLAAGLLIIGGGWLGAARHDTVPEQLPFMISGGLIGLAIVLASTSLLIIRSLRQHRDHISAQLTQLIEEIAARGTGRVASEGSESAAGGNSLVAVGASSYHLPTCRLVEKRRETEMVPVDVARARELAACRVCKPPV
jgi:hypothetical protein